MKKLFLIWIAISLAIFVLFDSFVDFRSYFAGLNGRLPNWSQLLTDFQNELSQVREISLFPVQVNDLQSFFLAFGQFFVGIYSFLRIFFRVLIALPVKALLFLIQTIVAFIPRIVLGGA